MNKKLLRTSVIASVMAMAFTASAWADNYTVVNPDTLENHIHDSVTWDGAYFNQQNGFPDVFGTASLMNSDNGVKVDGTGYYKFSYGGGTVYGTQVNGNWVYNFNAFSTDALPNGVTLPSAVYPTSWNANWDKLIQIYDMDYAATMAAFEAERRIVADNNLHLDDVKSIEHSLTNGILTTTVIGNDNNPIDSATADIGKYVKENAGNATYQGDTTINRQITKNKNDIANNTQVINQHNQQISENITNITNNKNDIDNIKKKYVQQITENNAGDAWTVTQTVNGQTNTVQITDEHINSYSMSVVGDSIESQITTNFGGNFEQSVRVGDATINYAGDIGTQNNSTIEQAINKNYTKIENVENNYVTNITNRQDGTEVINNKTYNVEYYQVTQNVTDANGNTTVETVNIKDTTLVSKRVTSGSVPNASANNALSYDFDPNTGIPQVFVEFEDTSGNVVQGAIDVASLMVTTADTTDGNIEVEGNGQGFGKDYRLADNININRSLTVSNNVTVNPDGRISGVADGEISANSTEAINGSQLWETNRNMDKLGGRLDKVGAGAAALAALHPLDFDPDDKLQFSAGVGNYKGETAAALGAFYRPTEKVMFSVAGTMGNGENMVNAGVTFALDRKNNVSNSRVAMAHEIQDLRDQVAALTALVSQIAGKGNPLLDTVMFPDVPENHWAYDYVEGLQKRGIIEGYPDGNFGGDRSMTRYEYAAMLYRALEKGFPVDGRLLKEFEAELGRIRIDRIKGADDDANKVERVRVNDYEDRDDYGSKLAQVVADAAPAIEEEPAA